MEKELEKLLMKANGAIDKVIEHSPRIIEDYIQYKTVIYITEPIMLLILLLSIIFISRKFGDKEYDYIGKDINFFGRYYGFGGLLLYILFSFIGILFVISIFCSVNGLILINTSKELFILKQFILK